MRAWLGGAMALGKYSEPKHPTNLDNSKGSIALAVGAGGVVWTFFSLVYIFSFLSLFLGDGPI